MVNRNRNPVEFLLGMMIFFVWGYFGAYAMGASFRATNAIEVFVYFVMAMVLIGVAYAGLWYAANGE